MTQHIVWSRTRRAVHAALDTLTSAEFSAEQFNAAISRAAREMDTEPHAVVGALREVVARGGARKRLFAALFVLRFSQWHAPLVDAELLAQARETLIGAMRTSERDEKLSVCTVLAAGYVPTDVIEPLFEVMHGVDEACRFAAAAALSAVKPNELHALAERREQSCSQSHSYDLSFQEVELTLRSGLVATRHAATRSMCAAALVRAWPGTARTITAALGVLRAVAPEFKYPILVALEQSGCNSKPVLDEIAALATDRQTPAAIRASALESLGVLTKEQPSVLNELLNALSSAEPEVVRGALRGLCQRPAIPHDALEPCISLLQSELEEVRILAARGIATMRPTPRAGVEALVERIGVEGAREALQAVMGALASTGEVALPFLLDIVADENVNRRNIAAQVVVEMGLVGARALLQFAREERCAAALEVLAGVFIQLGSTAEPLVPEILNAVETAEDSETLAVYVLCLCFTGCRKPEALRGLADALQYAPDDVAVYIERALRAAGVVAVPALSAALAENTGGDAFRLTSLLAELSRGSLEQQQEPTRLTLGRAQVERFENFGHDKELLTYVYVARVWAKQGPLSLKNVAVELAEQQKQGTVPPTQSVEFRTICGHVMAVRTWSRSKIVTYHARRAGGLTEAGITLLRELEAYFESKYGHAV
jgi:hypothetical protein